MIQDSGFPGYKHDENTYFARGTQLSLPVDAIHYDESSFPCASRFDAFRFSGPVKRRKTRRKAQNLETPSEVLSWEVERKWSLTQTGTRAKERAACRIPGPVSRRSKTFIATTGDKLLSFGYGQIACPGRFFASHVMSLMPASCGTVIRSRIHGGKAGN